MRVQTSSPPSEFPTFCEAVRVWLRDVPCLDPSLAAVADLVEAMPTPNAEQHLAHLAESAADMHGALGASTLLSLWSCLPR